MSIYDLTISVSQCYIGHCFNLLHLLHCSFFQTLQCLSRNQQRISKLFHTSLSTAMNFIKSSPPARCLYLLLQGHQFHKGGLQCKTSLQNTRLNEATMHSPVMQRKAHISQTVAILPYTKHWLLAGQYNDIHFDIVKHVCQYINCILFMLSTDGMACYILYCR